mmetsp:Transcript_25720/g.86432  ORF Transcript_25720/g.86432 Transcript_25720/m.86432 type:complete len:496 (-) Transcript_25720:353-1840(-)
MTRDFFVPGATSSVRRRLTALASLAAAASFCDCLPSAFGAEAASGAFSSSESSHSGPSSCCRRFSISAACFARLSDMARAAGCAGGGELLARCIAFIANEALADSKGREVGTAAPRRGLPGTSLAVPLVGRRPVVRLVPGGRVDVGVRWSLHELGVGRRRRCEKVEGAVDLFEADVEDGVDLLDEVGGVSVDGRGRGGVLRYCQPGEAVARVVVVAALARLVAQAAVGEVLRAEQNVALQRLSVEDGRRRRLVARRKLRSRLAQRRCGRRVEARHGVLEVVEHLAARLGVALCARGRPSQRVRLVCALAAPHAVDEHERGARPERVAAVDELVRAALEAPFDAELPAGEPALEVVDAHARRFVEDFQRRHSAKHVATVRLDARLAAEAALVRLTRQRVLGDARDELGGEHVVQRGDADDGVRPADVDLTVVVHAEAAGFVFHRHEELVQRRPVHGRERSRRADQSQRQARRISRRAVRELRRPAAEAAAGVLARL